MPMQQDYPRLYLNIGSRIRNGNYRKLKIDWQPLIKNSHNNGRAKSYEGGMKRALIVVDIQNILSAEPWLYPVATISSHL